MPEYTEISTVGAGVVELTAANWPEMVTRSPVPVLVVFGAQWCPHCRAMAPVIASVAQEYAGSLVVGEVNTDRERQLSREFSVHGIPQIMLFDKGEAVERPPAGGMSTKQLLALIGRHLPKATHAEAPARPAFWGTTPVELQSYLNMRAMSYADRFLTPSEDKRLLRALVAANSESLTIAQLVLPHMAMFAASADEVGRDGPDGVIEFKAALESSLGVGFDPIIIAAIISAVMMLIQTCPLRPVRPGDLKPARVAPVRRVQRAILCASIRREAASAGAQLTYEQGFRYADLAYALADAASDDSLRALISDCGRSAE